jgi:hypothetical protein
MKPTDYDMVKLALNSVDLVILRSLVEQAMKCGPDADRQQRLDLLIRARDLLAEFYLVQGNGHGRELGKSRTRIGVNPQAKPCARLWRLLRSPLPHYASQTVFERADQIIENRSLAGGENHVRGHSS